MAELKPCPFCGGEAGVWVEFVPYFDGYGFDEKNLYHCGCRRCGISESCFWLKDLAIRLWNITASDH